MSDTLIDGAAERLERRTSPTTSIRKDLSVSFEFFPPATPAGFETLEASAQQLAPFSPSFVSVTYGAGGSSQEKTFAALDMLAANESLDVAGHLTCVAADKRSVDAVIDGYLDRGVNRIVALRGDAPADAEGCGEDGRHPNGYCDAAELVAAIRSRPDADEIDVSVAAYPEVHPKAESPASDMDNLKRKIDAGADRALTQFFFDTDVFLRFLENARAAGITAPIVPGICRSPTSPEFVGSRSAVARRFPSGCTTCSPISTTSLKFASWSLQPWLLSSASSLWTTAFGTFTSTR